jgi:CDP-glucose 4,6-dehydratase|tara:strand:- start:3208 stop:4269 length:1062 start_codon:yes stop_codon:yes gene_type:complete
MKKFYKNKKILVTGVTGFKGAWLSQWLISLGAKVYGLGYNPNQNKNLFYKLNLQKKVKTKLFDIRNYKKLNNLIKNIKPSIIFHLAAQPLIYESYKKPHLTFDVNYRGTLNLLEISRGINSIKSIVVVTSDKCYESNNSSKGFKETDLLGGIDPYSASKSSTEIMVRAYRKTFFTNKKNVGLSTARAGNVIGGGDWSLNRLIPDCVRSLIKNKVIEIRNPNFNRPWQHVLEPLKGYLILAMQQFKNPKKFSGAWNFGTKPNSLTNVKSIVNYIIEFWGTGKLKIRKNKLYEQQNLQLNINKATKYLKWYPTYNIKQSVRFTTDWYLKVLKHKKKPSLVTLDQITEYEKDSKIR